MTEDKPPIVLLHGFRGAPIGLEAIAKSLRIAGYKVHTPAVPPFADSELLESYTPKSYADFVKSYINEHQLNHPILIGHSMASLIVAATAEHYPRSINQKLILLSPLSEKPSRFIGKISPLSAYFPRQIVDYVTTRFLFVPHNQELLKETLKLTKQCSTATHLNGRRKDIVAASKFSSNHSVGDSLLSQDILIIAGEHDRLIKQTSTKKLAQTLNAKLTLLPQTGHLHNYEQPEETSVAIIDFLQK